MALVVLLGGLVVTQLVRSDNYRAIGLRQHQRRVLLPAPRGVIYDRDHRVLAGNRVQVAAAISLGDVRRDAARQSTLDRLTLPVSRRTGGVAKEARVSVLREYLARLDMITGRHASLDLARLDRAWTQERTAPFVLLDDLTEAECAKLQTALPSIGPVYLFRSTARSYPQGRTAAHALGRVRRALTSEDKISIETRALPALTTVGESGMEQQYEDILGGKAGEAVVRVDALGFLVGPPQELRPPIWGHDVVTSLDLDVQLAAERALEAVDTAPRGAAVALSVRTGEVLALVSKPDFDLNAVSPALSIALKEQLDAEGAWLNRATQGLYPPGSTFKIFTVLAALRAGTLHPDDAVFCTGALDIGGRRFACHQAEGHGTMTLATALPHSCNVFAYMAGLAAGPEAIAAEARRFHLDQPTQLDLPFEAHQMFVPDPDRNRSAGRRHWTAGDTANLSIGQGALRCTPLQAACAIASLARGETLTVPTLVHQPRRRASGTRPPEPLALDPAATTALRQSLEAVIATGIGRNAQVPGYRLAGKTGTAQVERTDGIANTAWCVAFAPMEQPEIAIAVVVEGTEPGVEFTGAEFAAPIVSEIAATYFDHHPSTASDFATLGR